MATTFTLPFDISENASGVPSYPVVIQRQGLAVQFTFSSGSTPWLQAMTKGDVRLNPKAPSQLILSVDADRATDQLESDLERNEALYVYIYTLPNFTPKLQQELFDRLFKQKHSANNSKYYRWQKKRLEIIKNQGNKKKGRITLSKSQVEQELYAYFLKGTPLAVEAGDDLVQPKTGDSIKLHAYGCLNKGLGPDPATYINPIQPGFFFLSMPDVVDSQNKKAIEKNHIYRFFDKVFSHRDELTVDVLPVIANTGSLLIGNTYSDTHLTNGQLFWSDERFEKDHLVTRTKNTHNYKIDNQKTVKLNTDPKRYIPYDSTGIPSKAANKSHYAKLTLPFDHKSKKRVFGSFSFPKPNETSPAQSPFKGFLIPGRLTLFYGNRNLGENRFELVGRGGKNLNDPTSKTLKLYLAQADFKVGDWAIIAKTPYGFEAVFSKKVTVEITWGSNPGMSSSWEVKTDASGLLPFRIFDTPDCNRVTVKVGSKKASFLEKGRPLPLTKVLKDRNLFIDYLSVWLRPIIMMKVGAKTEELNYHNARLFTGPFQSGQANAFGSGKPQYSVDVAAYLDAFNGDFKPFIFSVEPQLASNSPYFFFGPIWGEFSPVEAKKVGKELLFGNHKDFTGPRYEVSATVTSTPLVIQLAFADPNTQSSKVKVTLELGLLDRKKRKRLTKKVELTTDEKGRLYLFQTRDTQFLLKELKIHVPAFATSGTPVTRTITIRNQTKVEENVRYLTVPSTVHVHCQFMLRNYQTGAGSPVKGIDAELMGRKKVGGQLVYKLLAKGNTGTDGKLDFVINKNALAFAKGSRLFIRLNTQNKAISSTLTLGTKWSGEDVYPKAADGSRPYLAEFVTFPGRTVGSAASPAPFFINERYSRHIYAIEAGLPKKWSQVVPGLTFEWVGERTSLVYGIGYTDIYGKLNYSMLDPSPGERLILQKESDKKELHHWAYFPNDKRYTQPGLAVEERHEITSLPLRIRAGLPPSTIGILGGIHNAHVLFAYKMIYLCNTWMQFVTGREPSTPTNSNNPIPPPWKGHAPLLLKFKNDHTSYTKGEIVIYRGADVWRAEDYAHEFGHHVQEFTVKSKKHPATGNKHIYTDAYNTWFAFEEGWAAFIGEIFNKNNRLARYYRGSPTIQLEVFDHNLKKRFPIGSAAVKDRPKNLGERSEAAFALLLFQLLEMATGTTATGSPQFGRTQKTNLLEHPGHLKAIKYVDQPAKIKDFQRLIWKSFWESKLTVGGFAAALQKNAKNPSELGKIIAMLQNLNIAE